MKGIWAISVLASILILGSVAPSFATIFEDQEKQSLGFDGLSIPFIENVDQKNQQVKFYANTFAGTVFVTETDLTYSQFVLNEGAQTTFVFKENFVNGKLNPIGAEKSKTIVNYFIGNEEDWRTNIPTFDVVDLGTVWNLIDVELKAHGNNIEKIFKVSPGGNVNDIKIDIDGITGLSIDNGLLILETELGNISMTNPVAYQDINGVRTFVDVSYTINKNSYGFSVGHYDPNHTLIIDPLLASTFIGGTTNENGNAITSDSSGNIFVTGLASLPSDYPTTSGVFGVTSNGGSGDVFVSKLNNDLTSLMASSFLGGDSFDEASGIAVDQSDNVFVTGRTNSQNFPLSFDAFQTSHMGSFNDGFVTKLSNDLTSIEKSTYIGGTGQDFLHDIIIGSNGDVLIVGSVTSFDFPTTPGAFRTGSAGDFDLIVSRLSNDLSSLEASTYIGGGRNQLFTVELGKAITEDPFGNIIIVGDTNSNTYPTTPNAFDTEFTGQALTDNGIISKFNSELTELLASTYFGPTTSSALTVSDVTTDSLGNIYITGITGNRDFPTTPGAFQESTSSSTNAAFVTKFDPDLSFLEASTLIDGPASDGGSGIALDSSERVYVTGFAGSDFPVTSGAFDTTIDGFRDFFVLRINSDFSDLEASTYIGGSGNEFGPPGITIFADEIFISGQADSTDYPTTENAYQESLGGSNDVVISKFDADLSAPDTDGDGVLDDNDNCPLIANTAQTDTDNDGIGDVCDDDDNDGIVDVVDTQPLVFSDSFSDASLGGTTFGKIIRVPTGAVVQIFDEGPNLAQGIHVTATGDDAVVSVCDQRGITMLTPGSYDLSCSSSTIGVSSQGIITNDGLDSTTRTIQVISGTARYEVASMIIVIGAGEKVTLSEKRTVFGQSLFVTSNIGTIDVLINGRISSPAIGVVEGETIHLGLPSIRQLTLSSVTGTSGTNGVWSVSGFPLNTIVNVSFDGFTIGSSLSDEFGAAGGLFTVPAILPFPDSPRYDLATSPLPFVSIPFGFGVLPAPPGFGVVVSPQLVTVGGSFLISGSGATPGDSVGIEISVKGSEDSPLITTTNSVTSAGFYSHSLTSIDSPFTLSSLPETFSVKATDLATGLTSSSTIVVTPPEPATLKIIKNAIGGDDSFRFFIQNSEGGFPVDIDTSINNVFGPIEIIPGENYSISEVISDSWNFVRVACTINGFSIGNPVFSPNPGNVVECTFTNEFIPPNTAPVAVDDTAAATAEDTPTVITSASLLANDSDVDGDALSITVVSAGNGGTPVLSGDGTSITFTPTTNFNGDATFSYKANDGLLDSNTAIVSITIDPVNDLPTANDDAFTVDEGTTGNNFDVLVNDSILPDIGETLTITSTGIPDNGGTASIVGNTIEYSSSPEFFGTETFTYTINDGTQGSDDIATVTVTVNEVPSSTPPGSDVEVNPIPEVSVTFSQVDQSGDTTVTSTTTNPGPDRTGFKFLGTYYDVITDANFSGPVTICLNYDGSVLPPGRENNLKIFHLEGSAWTDVTSFLDPSIDVICGTVTSLSFFAAAFDNEAPDTTISSEPSTPTSSTSATFTFSGSDNVTVESALIFECSLDGSTFVSCSSPKLYSSLSDGAHTFEVISIDEAGNIDPTPATFNWFVDATPPSITAPDGVTAEATGEFTSVAIGTATATDAVGSVTITNDAPPSFQLGDTDVTWTATDGVGNSADAIQTITVQDTTPPSITAPADITAEATGEFTSVAIGTATATDAVGPVTITNDAPTLFPLGDTDVTWTATDGVGNSVDAIQTITVQDTTPPSITTPADITAEATGIQTLVDIGIATVFDLIDPNPTLTNNAPESFPLGVTPVIWTATDSFGNTASATQNVTVDIINGTPLKGQRSDVNDFLTYLSTQEATTPLGPETTSFTLLIKYGATTDETTFSAVLNGVEVGTRIFHAEPGFAEAVTIPLDPGRNVLKISIDGQRTDGRTATDTDRLVFVVK